MSDQKIPEVVLVDMDDGKRLVRTEDKKYYVEFRGRDLTHTIKWDNPKLVREDKIDTWLEHMYQRALNAERQLCTLRSATSSQKKDGATPRFVQTEAKKEQDE